MSYLSRLKAEFSENGLPSQLTKPTKAPSVSFVGAQGKHIPEIGEQETRPDVDADALRDPAVEARRQRVLDMLADRPGIIYAVVVDNPDTDPVIVALGIRGAMQDSAIVTCEFRIPREKFDPFLLLDLIERHGASVH